MVDVSLNECHFLMSLHEHIFTTWGSMIFLMLDVLIIVLVRIVHWKCINILQIQVYDNFKAFTAATWVALQESNEQ